MNIYSVVVVVVVAYRLSCVLFVCVSDSRLMELLNSTLIDHMGDRNAISCSSSIATTLFLLLMIYFDRIGFCAARERENDNGRVCICLLSRL